MNATIVCNCKTVIVYDSNLQVLRCPACNTRWVQKQPPMVDERGLEAENFHPHLMSHIADAPLCDEWCQKVIDAIKLGVDEHNKRPYSAFFKQDYPPGVAFVFGGGPVYLEWSKGVELCRNLTNQNGALP